MKLTKVEKARRDVESQRKWIAEHGGDLAGYIARYGPADGDPHKRVSDGGRYGLGGPAIYAADVGVLNAVLGEYTTALAAVERRSRSRSGRVAPVRLTIRIPVEVDVDAYNAEYGSADDPNTIAVDLTAMVREMVVATLAHLAPAVTVRS